MRCVIVGGADIADYNEIKSYIKSDDYLIFCDSGLKHANELGVSPSLIIGDFDSHEKPDSDIETIVLPCEKDDTDTVFAVKEAVKRGFEDYLLIGVAGNRLDHTFVNISILNYLFENGKNGIIVDDFSEMEVVGKETAFVNDTFSYFSLVNMFGISEGVTIKNAKYTLENAVITSEYQYATSNEVIKGKTAEITVDNGKLLLIKVK